MARDKAGASIACWLTLQVGEASWLMDFSFFHRTTVSTFRINLETGKKEAKLLDKEHKKKQEDSIGVIDDDDANAGQTESGKLRSYQELQDILAEQKMKLNTEFEQITVLVENFANATTDVKINKITNAKKIICLVCIHT